MTLQIFQVYEFPRTILIVYEYDSLTQMLKYGATIHYSDLQNISYDRQKHLATALFRFRKNPKNIRCDLSNLNLENREKKIRSFLHQFGCK